MSDNKNKLFGINVVNLSQSIEAESFLLNSRNNEKENSKAITKDEVKNNCEEIYWSKQNCNENLKPSVSGCTFLNNKRNRRIGVKKSLRMFKFYKILIGILVNGACEYLLTKLIRRSSKLKKIKGRKFEKSKFVKKNYVGDEIGVPRIDEKKHDEDLESRKEISRFDSNSAKIDGNLIANIGPDFASEKNGFDNSQCKIYNKDNSKTRNCDVIIDETPVDSFETIEKSFNEIDNEILGKECTDKYEVYHFDDYPFQEETLIISERENKRFVSFSKSTEDLGEGGRGSDNVEKVSSSKIQKSCKGRREKKLNNFKESEIQKISEKFDDKDADEENSAIGKSLSKLNGDDERNNKKMINNEGELRTDNNYMIYKTKNSFKKISNVVKNCSIKLSKASKEIEKADERDELSLVGIRKENKNYSPIKLFDNNEANKKKKKNKVKKIINILSSADLSLRSKNSGKNDSNFIPFSRYSIPVSIELNRISKNLLKFISKKNFIQTKITSYFPALRNVVSRKKDKPSIGFNKVKKNSLNLRNDDDNEKENNVKKEEIDKQRLLPIIESDIILKDQKKLVYSKIENDFKTAGISFPRLTTNGRGIELTKKLSNNKMKKISKIELCTRSDIIEDSDTSMEKTTVIPPSYSIFSNDQDDRRPILDLDSQQREDLLAPWETIDIYEKVNRWHEDTFEP